MNKRPSRITIFHNGKTHVILREFPGAGEDNFLITERYTTQDLAQPRKNGAAWIQRATELFSQPALTPPSEPEPVEYGPFTEEVPQFKHDCDGCIFLGRFTSIEDVWTGERFDLYVHVNSDRITTIARYSDSGPDYFSWELGSPSHNPAITECARRAYWLSATLLSGAHYSLMDHVSFWSDKGDCAASAILVGKASDMRTLARAMKAQQAA